MSDNKKEWGIFVFSFGKIFGVGLWQGSEETAEVLGRFSNGLANHRAVVEISGFKSESKKEARAYFLKKLGAMSGWEAEK